MKFRLYTENGSLNSKPVFEAASQGLKKLGYSLVDQNEDISVIWSVLWNGRMSANKQIYEKSLREKRPILILEVGNLIRNHTWRVSLNNVNALGFFGNDTDLDINRPSTLKLSIKPINEQRKEHILIACQHERSLQWQGNPSTAIWINDTVNQLRKYTDRPIVIRPHPRARIDTIKLDNVRTEKPIKILNSYDDFDINYNCHTVLNHNSGPSIQAIINGTPTVCDQTSLAYPLSTKIENIETPMIPDRHDWFVKLCHTEWTIDEIKNGIPLKRVLQNIEI